MQTDIAANNAHKRGAEKFASVLLPIVFFVLFDCIALGLNFWISFRLAENAMAINLAGRQRMLSQKMTKALLNIELEEELHSGSNREALAEFAEAFLLFDKTLNGFWSGGETLGGDYEPVQLDEITDEDAKIGLAQGIQVWSQVKGNLLPVLGNGEVSAETIVLAMASLKQSNLLLLRIMDKITLALERDSSQEASYIRLFQSIVLTLALFNFALICRRLMSNLGHARQNAKTLAKIINSIETAVLLYDKDGAIFSANAAADALFGFHEGGLEGRPVEQLIVGMGQELFAIRHNGETFNAKISSNELFEYDQPITVCTVVDLSEQRQKEKHLLRLATHDSLTDLPNRLLLMERLEQELLRAKRGNYMVAVMFLDLDGFKEINDSLGHDRGDHLLKLVSRRLMQSCREVDTVSRIGGDEFVILLDSIRSKKTVEKVAKTILNRVQQEFLLGEQAVGIGVSIGIALYPDDHLEAELLLKYADDAMYRAKSQGKHRYCFNAEK